jgi:hypothetical protein
MPSLASRSLIVTIFYVGLFNYTYLYFGSRSLPLVGAIVGQHIFTPLYFGFFLAAIAYIWRRRTAPFRTLTIYLNIVSATLLAFALGGIGSASAGPVPSPWQSVVDGMVQENLRQPLQPPASPPDIYYIILDGYARADVLAEFYGHDNSAFLDSLTARGFYVPGHSFSNYPQTYFSLASSLNLNYLDDVRGVMGDDSHDRRPLRYLIENNSVVQALRQAGYAYVLLSSDYSATQGSSQVDFCFCESYGLSEFENVLLTPTPFWLWSPQSFQYDAHRQKIESTLTHLRKLPHLAQPMFVFAHIMAPHPPFVFGPQGESLPQHAPFTISDGGDYPGSHNEYIERYRGQVTYLNTQITAVVDAILARSSTPPVIILQGDHGPRSMPDGESSARERLGIFAAYYLPNSDNQPFYDAMTPVNTFRLIFNRYFGTHYATLKDKSYFSTWNHPYQFAQAIPDHFDHRAAIRTAR